MLTTYTNALSNASESLLRQLLGDVVDLDKQGKLPKVIRITTLHKTAQWIARRSGERFDMASDQHRQQALQAARTALQPQQVGDAAKILPANAIADLRDDYLLAEFDWVIEGQNCKTEADFLAANRNGRGIPFTQPRRQAVK